MKEIQLTKGKVTIVDDADFEWLNIHKWHITSSGYAARRVWPEDKILLMHRSIMDTPKGMDTDHKNHDTLDNRRENLRVCSRSENNLNRGPQPHNTSGFKGVSWSKEKNKWRAYSKGIHLGYFIDKNDAAMAYDKKAKELFGEFAKLNFSNAT